MKEFLIGSLVVISTICLFIAWVCIFAWAIKKYTGFDDGWEYALSVIITGLLCIFVPLSYFIGQEILKQT